MPDSGVESKDVPSTSNMKALRRSPEAQENHKRHKSDEVIMANKIASKFPPGASSSGCGEGSSSSETTKEYGMLVVIGYNGSLPEGGSKRRQSTYILRKSGTPSGVRPYKQHLASSETGMQVIHSSEAHSVSYTLTRGQSVVVEYTRDAKTDMFQIGRSSDSKIDFLVTDTVPGTKKEEGDTQRSTISRYACRIVVDRDPPYMARVYAAGFDKSSNIFLGERAPKWKSEQGGMMDGLTTNGILLMNPKGGANNQAGIWREISVCGNVFGLRKTRSAVEKGKFVEEECNVLMDGSLIDLCGAVLLWRSAEGMSKMPSQEHMEKMRKEINSMRPQCPVGLTTLQFSSGSQRGTNSDVSVGKEPYVYLKCGHVHGYHAWNSPGNESGNNLRTCPVCLQKSCYVQLSLGREATFYDGEDATPSHAFVPCGHVCSEATVKFWAQIPIPHGCDQFQAICPFCAIPLEGEEGAVKLIFSTED